MSPKAIVMIGVTVGSSIGGYVPALWGGSLFSVSSVLLGTIGGIIGLVITYRMVRE